MDPSTHQGSPSQPPPGSHDSNDNDHTQHRVRFAEGEPQASYTIHQPTPKREQHHAAASVAAPPAVYWDNKKHNDSDRESDANLAGYTFYREGTPPPPDYEGPGKRLGRGGPGTIGESSTVGGGTIRSNGDYSIGPLNPLETNWSQNDGNNPPPTKRRKVLWAIIAAAVLVIVAIAVGLGVGLGVGLPKQKGAHADAVEQPTSSILVSGPSNSPAPTDPPTNAPGGTGAAAGATTGSAAAPRPTYNSDCPALNNTVYNVPGSTISFRRVCGIDYSGDGATDLAHAWTDSMADCMNSCASFNQCTACAWGYLEGDRGGKHRCYMKTDLKKSHKAASDWCFAILQ
ncbi:hypothetical protein CHGG_06102 [Chaetomium globosum CBS 148.51]|uniref:Apple domain-containing protein n=1 Tax=Chaetomium globosum (strain ATCC 6205 / CBS 148.51 / DSM 1962 / NBRC 6347 / NRRL 1970) TaxID=306901 RepID=Q2H5G3_CHAGB|nr:uncharacterized protein CHGG_06102 [Chaetomium globosum CBS 148.51]EAQ89483.1 hypothetical protein CHGG_06102 [Chaetomium globosum CBS 148.51]